jgi:hypothetical protein
VSAAGGDFLETASWMTPAAIKTPAAMNETVEAVLSRS